MGDGLRGILPEVAFGAIQRSPVLPESNRPSYARVQKTFYIFFDRAYVGAGQLPLPGSRFRPAR